MRERETFGFAVLPEARAESLRAGGIIEPGGLLIHDMVVPVSLPLLKALGRAFYTTGGLTGGNPWKDKRRF